ncbi:endonuclease MutS2 [Loigolactobacillus backii]|uniref:endonuclease MutS2 n=1 Tax=Loigolactobacillus backii TaxID=375175 RepID=UPI0007F0D089|nr:endonuclease MutS2 [Loigolactobacillus backii]ANK59207.1 DNA mismatch repair protein MutS [Loigolactobacillus backii]
MDSKILATLEFSKIKQAIEQYTVSALGKQMSRQLVPTADQATIQRALDETKDAADILRLKGAIPVPQLENIRPHMKRLVIGATLNGLELAQIGRVLRATAEVDRFFTDLRGAEIDLRQLYHWQDELATLTSLTRRLRVSLEDDGHVTDDASTKLKGIRNGIQQLEGQIRERMGSFTRGKQAKYLSEPIITIRNERYVIPVKQEYRSHFGGVVHDQSATGLTLFIEPQSVLDLNNRLRQRQVEERQEVQRLLAELSNELAPYQTEIIQNADILGHLDFANAKARYAKAIKATEPLLDDANHVNLRQARHPLIAADKVVANDISIGENFQAVVITGPNTGGKTITLKTIGLLQLMAQAGLFIPANEESHVGIFADIFADIGDEQSIEQNLSTFSAHMSNIVTILKRIDGKSLVLLDEVGAGTDPQEGAALAISILDRIGTIGSYVMATTHYPELKAYGYNRPNTINASMEFDVETLQPTYRLLMGVPGRSNAFDIALRLGLDPLVISQSKSLMSDDSQDLNNMITDLENQRKAAQKEYHEAQVTLQKATELYDDLESASREFFNARQTQLDKAKDQANEIVNKAQKESNQIIHELRQLQLSDQAGVKEHQLIAAKTDLENLKQNKALAKNKVLRHEKNKQALKVGDDVLVTTYGQHGVLLQQLDKKYWEVQVGIIKLKVKVSDLEKTKAEAPQKQKQHTTTIHATNRVNPTLDLRGERYENALAKVDRYIDSALLAGYPQVTIVHGKGTGVLRQGITSYLQGNRQVKKFAFAPANAGGNGATVVTFK